MKIIGTALISVLALLASSVSAKVDRKLATHADRQSARNDDGTTPLEGVPAHLRPIRFLGESKCDKDVGCGDCTPGAVGCCCDSSCDYFHDCCKGYDDICLATDPPTKAPVVKPPTGKGKGMGGYYSKGGKGMGGYYYSKGKGGMSTDPPVKPPTGMSKGKGGGYYSKGGKGMGGYYYSKGGKGMSTDPPVLEPTGMSKGKGGGYYSKGGKGMGGYYGKGGKGMGGYYYSKGGKGMGGYGKGSSEPPTSKGKGGSMPPSKGGSMPPSKGGSMPPSKGGSKGSSDPPTYKGGSMPPSKGGSMPPSKGGTMKPGKYGKKEYEEPEHHDYPDVYDLGY
uniref:SMB domain-containing protein n=1 Tax=Entomoneis paludosa TaxID=265537 RepID=A0A7S3DUJ6_9STRA|mmetsp:Transcript_38881/g.80741  ORF Transcript_38881/g.80741 Transcript_38881/m.80741 type:complete len:335 (+) Transcript_38881:82-1086(+)